MVLFKKVAKEGTSQLPSRPKEDASKLDLQIHPLGVHDGLIVKVKPPRDHSNPSIHHVPCDIVLVIDVSGSMGSNAPVPTNPGEAKEEYGLSVLDLTKHAARTILETLGSEDRLGLVAFDTNATVCCSLAPRTISQDS
jgi:hypothetical protein